MSKEIKEMIELFLINIGMVFLMFFPERSSIFPTICFGVAMLIFDVLFVLSAFKYKCNIFDYKEHKVLAIICYLAILFIFVAFGYLLLEPWFF